MVEAARCDLLIELAACLQALQPQQVAAGAGAPRRLRPFHPLCLQRALKAALPRSQLEWGTQHDAAEALEVCARRCHAAAWASTPTAGATTRHVI